MASWASQPTVPPFLPAAQWPGALETPAQAGPYLEQCERVVIQDCLRRGNNCGEANRSFRRCPRRRAPVAWVPTPLPGQPQWEGRGDTHTGGTAARGSLDGASQTPANLQLHKRGVLRLGCHPTPGPARPLHSPRTCLSHWGGRNLAGCSGPGTGPSQPPGADNGPVRGWPCPLLHVPPASGAERAADEAQAAGLAPCGGHLGRKPADEHFVPVFLPCRLSHTRRGHLQHCLTDQSARPTRAHLSVTHA